MPLLFLSQSIHNRSDVAIPGFIKDSAAQCRILKIVSRLPDVLPVVPSPRNYTTNASSD